MQELTPTQPALPPDLPQHVFWQAICDQYGNTAKACLARTRIWYQRGLQDAQKIAREARYAHKIGYGHIATPDATLRSNAGRVWKHWEALQTLEGELAA